MKEEHFSELRLREIDAKIEALKQEFRKHCINEVQDMILDNSDLLRLLKISQRTAFFWREQKMITYSQIGQKIFYRLSDVQEMLNRYRFYKKDSEDSS